MKKPISDAKLHANRANAKKSTGPRTLEGKARSSRNALTHGLTARDLTALGESPAHFTAALHALHTTWCPSSPHEANLLHRLAEIEVRLNRFTRIETGLLDLDMPEIKPTHSRESINSAAAGSFNSQKDSFNLLSRYEANLSRAYDRTLRQFLTLRKAAPQPSAPLTPSLDQTNPPPIENTDLPSTSEPIRTERNPAATPEEAASRRHGKLDPISEHERPPVELVWFGPDGQELGFSRRDREQLSELRRLDSKERR